ncbi:transcription termination factor NusA [Armatimonas sp.]|uniref:transcription termination factor NusA n=1 Tax=Armatimonas sp. TaxID=1872638 RepID=UPI00286B1684|nr:transcription termination factor NusA [Armatimonas sp.]
MNAEFIEALRQLEREKDIPFDTLWGALEAAMSTAYKKTLGVDHEVSLRIEHVSGKQPIYFRRRVVVENVVNPHGELSLADARARNAKAELGMFIEDRLGDRDMERMSRIAAQTAKQVVVQRIREAERDKVFDEYDQRKGELLTGTVYRREGRNVIINLGKIEAILPDKEQVESENYRHNERFRFLVLDVRKGAKGPQVIVSRSHPSLIRRLFEMEVPEIAEGVVQIKSVAREAGQRSKIAVSSKEERVDPVGSCVGHRGQRVQAVVDELRGEKMDIVRWGPDMRLFITESLSPAKVASVKIDEEQSSAFVIVPDNQLSLAIGKAGQNVRLAARLTGWRIDIRSESQVAKDKQAGIAPEPAPSAAPVASAAPETNTDDEGADLPPLTLADFDDDAE